MVTTTGLPSQPRVCPCGALAIRRPAGPILFVGNNPSVVPTGLVTVVCGSGFSLVSISQTAVVQGAASQPYNGRSDGEYNRFKAR